MKIVTSRSRGCERRRAMSLLRAFRLDAKDLSLVDGREKRADSEAEKNPEQKRRNKRMKMPVPVLISYLKDS